ncbi:FGGY family carbohydrate kinase [Labrys monachus]|uniref:ATP:glycerol 3-phosphotransferase n=1 Tax=Labrys monachus TaxID=217067 RepID=A0ABU0FBW7_9HYPH|nr:FGGY family carbohydrate kinase [Labrys monachus]MDQ0391936.1 glycerol kinase [Labrys monachus]
MRIAAVDQGTTSTRVLVFEDDAPPRVAHAVRHRQSYPQPGWVEHDPLELLTNIEACLAAAGPVDAIGIANQGESCLAWDAVSGEPLSPVIVWQDNRTNDAIERLAAAGAAEGVAARTGLPLDCYFSASKLAWIVENIAPARAALDAGRLRLGTTDSFFLDRLAGTFATDATTASRTALMDLATLAWDEGLCRLFGVPREALAPIRPTSAAFGAIGGTPVTASVVDQQAALRGHGCRAVGDAKITFGTGAFALAVTGPDIARQRTDGLISTVAWQTQAATTYALEGGVYDVGSVVEWALRIGILDAPSELAAFAAPPALSRGLAFVPALSGLACPQWDRNAAGLWIGMTTATTRQDLQQSLLEGIAMQTREVVRAMDKAIGLGDAISVDGGLTASPYFLQFLADVTGKTIVRRANAELTAYGCALLAGLPESGGPSSADIAYSPGRPVKGADARYAEALARCGGWRSV